MAHFNHLNELSTDAVKNAIKEVRKTGAQIRTQSPLLAHINDDAEMWSKMWTKQVQVRLYSILHVCSKRYRCSTLFWNSTSQGI